MKPNQKPEPDFDTALSILGPGQQTCNNSPQETSLSDEEEDYYWWTPYQQQLQLALEKESYPPDWPY